MGHVGITAMGDAEYYAQHAERDLAVAEAAGGYYVKGNAGGEPSAAFLGRGLEFLGIDHGRATAERSAELMKSTWTTLSHPETGDPLGTAPRRYADTAENLAKIATTRGVSTTYTPKRVRAEGITLGEVQGELAKVLTPEEVRSMVVQAQASQRHARSFFDVTYSADKSISTAHVAAERAGDDFMASACEDSLLVSAEVIHGYIENEIGASRIGYHGRAVGGQSSGMRVRNRNLAAAAHVHHTSREGDPQDHVHILELNRGLDDTGQWHSLDGQALYLARPSATVRGSRAQELYLANMLGVRFEKDGQGGRRLVGVDQDICELFSKRRAVIEVKLEKWAEGVRDRTGREPSAKARAAQSQRIAKQTRAAKSEIDRDLAVEGYGEEADSRGLSLGKVHRDLYDSIKRAKNQPVDGVYDREAVVAKALEQIKVKQPYWNRHHMYAAIDSELPDNWPPGTTPEQLHQVTLELTAVALEREGIQCITPEQPLDRHVPAELADDRGLSMFFARGREVYAPASTLDEEMALLIEAQRVEAPRAALVDAEALVRGSGLSADQADAVVSLLSSGRSLEALIGPAGTGKSFTLAKLAELWPGISGGEGNVVGLAVSQNAAQVLTDEGFPVAANLTRWLMAQGRIAQCQAKGRPIFVRDREYVMAPGQLVVVDEASMADTTQLADVVRCAEKLGGKVLLAGDDRQLDAVGKGGALSMITGDRHLREVGAIHELNQVRRFRDKDGIVREWEAEASLLLREGVASALETYEDHGRIVTGSAEEVTQGAVDEAVAAILSGRSSALIVGTGELAAALSLRVQTELVDAGRVHASGGSARLSDGTDAMVGDWIQARRNDRDITDVEGHAITNRDVLVVEGVAKDGSIKARRRLDGGKLGARVNLPADYTGADVVLGYASTVHASQGRTVDTAAMVVDPSTSPELSQLYVGLTRGRLSNRVYVISENPDCSGVDLLTDVAQRDNRTKSVTEMKREQDNAAVSLARLGPAWAETMRRVEASSYRAGVEEALDLHGLLGSMMDDPAAPAFWEAVAEKHAAGYDVADLVASTLAGREVGVTGRSVAQVLHYRVTDMAFMQWEPAQSKTVSTYGTPGSYLDRSPSPMSLVRDLAADSMAIYARHLAAVMDARVDELGRRVAVESPAWALKHLGPVPSIGTTARETWEARAGAVEGYREQYVEDAPVDVANPVGRAPSKQRHPGQYTDWLRATEGLNLTQDNVKDPREMDDAELDAAMQRWADAVESAPAYVKTELLRAHTTHRHLQARYDRAAAGAKVHGPHMADLAAKVTEAAERVEYLQAAHDERGRWYDDTADLREAAQEARTELARRAGQEATPVVVAREDMTEREAKVHEAKQRQALRAQEREQQRHHDDGGITFEMKQ